MEHLDDIITPTCEWLKNGEQVALATVISTWGSSPRPVGGQMAINKDGEIIGSVSGGCVENSVISEAINSIFDRKLRIKDYGISDDLAWEIGLACGGELKILIQAIEDNDSILLQILDHIKKREPINLIINCLDGKRNIVNEGNKLFSDKSFFDKEKQIFYHAILPKPRLFIVGAVHISQSLVPMAKMCGYDVILIDPRNHFANKKRFPNCNIITEWPDEALKNFQLSQHCNLVTLTHDPKIDDPALINALTSNIGYIGSLGSAKTHDKRMERLKNYGIKKNKLLDIHGPIGLDIGSKTPEEISVSILAELTKFRRRTNAQN